MTSCTFPKPYTHWSTITFISVHAKPPSHNLLHLPLPQIDFPLIPLSFNLKLTLSPSVPLLKQFSHAFGFADVFTEKVPVSTS